MKNIWAIDIYYYDEMTGFSERDIICYFSSEEKAQEALFNSKFTKFRNGKWTRIDDKDIEYGISNIELDYVDSRYL